MTTTPTPIEPSENELKAARELRDGADGLKPREKWEREFALIMATHTRCDGLTAAQWKAKFEAEISVEWQKAWLQMKSALAEAQGNLELSMRLYEGKYIDWDMAGGPNQCAHGYAEGIACKECDRQKWSAYLTSRHPAKPETKECKG